VEIDELMLTKNLNYKDRPLAGRILFFVRLLWKAFDFFH